MTRLAALALAALLPATALACPETASAEPAVQREVAAPMNASRRALERRERLREVHGEAPLPPHVLKARFGAEASTLGAVTRRQQVRLRQRMQKRRAAE